MILPFCFCKSCVIIYLLLHAYFCKMAYKFNIALCTLLSLRKVRFSMQDATTSFLSFQGKDCEPPIPPTPLTPILLSPYTCPLWVLIQHYVILGEFL